MYFVNPSVLMKGRSFAVSSENPTGEKGGGSRGSAVQKTNPCTVMKPGDTLTVLDMDGPGEILSMWFGGRTDWNIILRIYWDGCEYPSVEAPISAFMGYGYYNNVRDLDGNFPTLNSALLMVAPCRGLNAYFRMPFFRHCRITVQNIHPSENRNVYYTVTGRLGPIAEDSLYFCASYRQARPVKQGEYYTIIDGIEGQGQFLGLTLSAGINGPNGCWVEGEAKMYLDDDEYPSINYTGTEDYFCGSYAFGYDKMGKYQPYSGLYAGMFAMCGGDVKDRSESVYNTQPRFMGYRWHLPDPILFTKNFRMVFQNMWMTDGLQLGRRDDYTSVAYWYQTLPARPLQPLPPAEELGMW